MSAAGQLGFLYRAVLRTELAGPGWTEQAGAGTLVTPAGLWLGVWDAAQAGDPEALIVAAQAAAAARGGALAGALVAQAPGAAGGSLTELADALYVYGYPAARAWPDSVQVLGRPSWPKPRKNIEVAETAAPWSEGIPEPGPVEDGVIGACLAAGPMPAAQFLVASVEGEPAGALQLLREGPVARVSFLWVTDAHRKQGVGAALLEQSAKMAQAQGCVALTVWTRSSGLLRYYFPRFGFAQQLSVCWYLAE